MWACDMFVLPFGSVALLLIAFADLTSAAFDETMMHSLAEVAGATYCDSDELESWTCRPCLDSQMQFVPGKIRLVEKKEIFQVNSTRVVVGKLTAGGCVVAIRGSHNIDNWILDFQENAGDPNATVLPDCDGCEVSLGFYSVWESVQRDVQDALTDVGCVPNDVLYITGHSLGAAVAHLAMYTLASVGYDVQDTYTFESPRVGNRAFRDAFRALFPREHPVFRVTHDRDPIVHFPVAAAGYEHVSTEVYYNYQDFQRTELQHKVCDDADGEDPTCSYQVSLYDVTEHCLVPFTKSGIICSWGCAADNLSLAAPSAQV